MENMENNLSHSNYGAIKPNLTATQNSGSPQTPAPIPAPLNPYQIQLKEHFGWYGLWALAVGLLAAFCFYKNPNAVTYPLFIGAIYLAAYRLLPSLEILIKKDSWFLTAAAMVLAFNSSFTASPTLHMFNHTAQILLGAVFLIHQCYDDSRWNIGKYGNAILRFWLGIVCCLHLPFAHGISFMKHLKSEKYKNLFLILTGFCAAVPAVFFLGTLLADADAVFHSILYMLVLDILKPASILEIILLVSGFSLLFYCSLGSVCSMGIPKEESEKNQKNPVAAISFTFFIGLLYLFFCVIQIIYLFGRKGRLPWNMTYAQYARQGFFQLLAVSLLNLVLVLSCLKYFKNHRLLSAMLVVISICTYIMIASAGYRMILYVGAYWLTFLRLFVLWFLGLLSILMAGVLILIFRPQFPLFYWCLVSVTVAYCGFAWSRPDYQIAKYNIAREDGWITQNNIDYLIRHLSADAAPAIQAANLDPKILDSQTIPHSGSVTDSVAKKAFIISSLRGIPWQNQPSWQPGIRSYNASLATAWKLANEYAPSN